MDDNDDNDNDDYDDDDAHDFYVHASTKWLEIGDKNVVHVRPWRRMHAVSYVISI